MSRLVSFDYAIKFLLKHKSDYEIVEGFISALLKEQGYKPVKIIALLDTESNKEEYSQKKSLADLIVEDEDHQKYIIEIERQQVKNFLHKSCFNTSRLIVDQLDSGNDYLGINKVFHISLLYFKIGNGPVYHGKTVIREIATDEKLSVQIEDEKNHKIYDATDIFAEYLFISIPQFNDKIQTELDEWLYVMKHEEVSSEFKSPYMRKLAERLDILKMNAIERDEYAYYIKQVATINNAFNVSEAKGREKGREEGIKIGEAKGIEKTAINMLKEKLDYSLIKAVTGFSQDELDKLKNKM